MSYWFRILAILCLVSVAVELTLWIIDVVHGLPFHGRWILLSSILWAVVFFLLARRGAKST